MAARLGSSRAAFFYGGEVMSDSERIIGRVVMWNKSKAFGFVERDDGGKDCFVHIADVRPKGTELSVGDAISFVVGEGRGGKLAAYEVRLLQPFRSADATVGEFAGLPGAINR